jgi:[NiFe] hydrogenase large subunit
MARITIDPVTRIEGHLKIEVEVAGGVVTGAWSCGTLFRGLELILKDRSPKDAWLFAQRVCGVCTYVHGVASVRAVENAAAITVPQNAVVVRNLLMGGQYVHDHPMHFYHLHGCDWIDFISALKADPVATATLAATVSPLAPSFDFAAVKTRLAAFAGSGRLGPFAGGWWGHPAYVLTPEENLLFAAHYLYALRQQIKAAQMHAIFGAKNPHIQSLRVGGITCKYDLTQLRIAEFRTLLTDMRSYIDTVYVPDAKYIAARYKTWIYGGFANYLTFGDFADSSASSSAPLLPAGIILNKSVGSVNAVDISGITEQVAHSWYSGTAQHPSSGTTVPAYTAYDTAGKYSWLKAPRYNGAPMEVGPLARMLVAYGSGVAPVKAAIDSALADTGLGLPDMHSTIGRILARAIETKMIADAMDGWLSGIDPAGITSSATPVPASCSGRGLGEAPRGALGHWIDVRNNVISNYQMVVPSTWNLSPRDSNETPGPVEQALIGTPVADASRPLEILRVVHSFDPCLACAVHVLEDGKKSSYAIKVR